MDIVLVWTYIYEWIEFICMAAAAIVTAALIINYRLKKSVPFLFFSGRCARELLYISVVSLQVIFVLSCVIFQKEIQADCAIYLAIFALATMITGKRWKLIITELLNTVFLFAALICGNIMFRYMQEIRVDIMVLVLYIVLNIFIITYLVFYFIWHMLELNISQDRGEGSEIEDYEDIRQQ